MANPEDMNISEPGRDSRHCNRLAGEKSPYLLQHAHNPVDWYPWGDEAFEKATREDKPVFLSIGYSTCHWCHVMERESFEDPEVARRMNEVFVPVKVDREERPDIDNVYMTVCQALTGAGGWPLTVILTPDKQPFFAGTYFPKETRHGRIGLLELIPRIRDLWETRRDEAVRSASRVAAVLQELSQDAPGDPLGTSVLGKGYAELSRRFDAERAGFGTAPKFPTAHNHLFLLRYWRRTGETFALEMVEKSLRAMRLGGIYDHVGLGFHRYATDAGWLVPHFEKMLYDQAMLAMAYTEAWQATGTALYRETAREILTYVLRDMTAPEGGFYSGEDADSEGEEGKFYVWTDQEIREVLGNEEAEFVIRVFNVQEGGNFADESTGRRAGANILHLSGPLDQVAAEWHLSEEELKGRLAVDTVKLFERRETRIPPFKDDKILTDWNGLMIAALAKAAQAFEEPAYARAAGNAAGFILEKMRAPDGGLLHCWREGGATDLEGFIDDYAFLIWGLLELYEADFGVRHLDAAAELGRYLLEHFWDPQGGGFHFTSDRGERLLARKKEIYDGALPSGNSVALLDLLRLARITADPALEEHANRLIQAFSGVVCQSPSAFTQFLAGVDFAIGPSCEVVITGRAGAGDTRELLHCLRRHYLPNKVVVFRPADESRPEITRLAKYTEAQTGFDGRATAYVCRHYYCEAPTTDPEQMLRLLTADRPE
ncbi:MAG: thioredoxin domain-containing protein [bacterium]